MSIPDDCTMCEREAATTRWGAPVCQPCYDWLEGLDAELVEMEAADPSLAEMGKRTHDALRRLHDHVRPE